MTESPEEAESREFELDEVTFKQWFAHCGMRENEVGNVFTDILYVDSIAYFE